MAITSSTTTALDVPTLVSQLMAVERRPIDTLNTQITSYQTKISSFGTLSGLVSSFQSAAQNLGTTLQKLAATPSDPSVFPPRRAAPPCPATTRSR
jgi:Flagellar capping protein